MSPHTRVTRQAARSIKALQYRPVVIRGRTPAPPTKVFNNVEMLLLILKNLSHLHLTRCERVHPVWKEIICTSPELQQQRFSEVKTTWEAVGSTAGGFNIYLPDKTAYDLQIRIVRPPLEVKDLNIYTICNLHPVLAAIENDCLVFGIRATTVLSWKVPGPWQDQFLTQPPLPVDERIFLLTRYQKLEYITQWNCATQLFEKEGLLSAHGVRLDMNYAVEGSRKVIVTLGDLRKWLEEEMSKYSKAEIAKRTLLFTVPLRQEERSRTVVHARKVERGELVTGTPEALAAWEEIIKPAYVNGILPAL